MEHKAWKDPFRKDDSAGLGPTAPTGELGEFAPGGDPKNLNEEGGQKPQGVPEGDAALREFAPISKATKYSSLEVDGQSVTIPTEGSSGENSRNKI